MNEKTCAFNGCIRTDTQRIKVRRWYVYLCPDHALPDIGDTQVDAKLNNERRLLRHSAAVAAMHALISNPVASQNICNEDPRYQKMPDGHYNFAQVVALNAVEFADALVERLSR